MPTATVKVQGPAFSLEVLALIDTGANVAVISRSLVKRLGLQLMRTDNCIETFQGEVHAKHSVLVTLRSCRKDFELKVHAVVLRETAGEIQGVMLPSDVDRDQLANKFIEQGGIPQLILGADEFAHAVSGTSRKVTPSIKAFESEWGDLLMGRHQNHPRLFNQVLRLQATTQMQAFKSLFGGARRVHQAAQQPQVNVITRKKGRRTSIPRIQDVPSSHLS